MNAFLSKRGYITLSIIILIIVGLNLLFAFISPKEIVDYIGVTNSYIIIFLMATVGGLSSFTGTTYFTTLATLGAGVENPLWLGMVGGIGIFISDSIFFLLAFHGKKHIPEKWRSTISNLNQKIQKYPLWIVLLLVYLYISFSPFPNDLLMIALAIAGYRYKHLFLILIAGSLTVSILVAHLGNFLN